MSQPDVDIEKARSTIRAAMDCESSCSAAGHHLGEVCALADSLLNVLEQLAGTPPVVRKLEALHIQVQSLELDCSQQADMKVSAREQRDQMLRNFKIFHRQLCERFGYHHDEKNWYHDQASLIEHIARQVRVSPDDKPSQALLEGSD